MSAESAPTVVIEKTIAIAARPETVWPLLTESEGVCQWWGTTAEVEPRPGGAYRVTMENGAVMSGEVVDVDVPSRLVFTFGWEQPPPAGPVPPGSTRVEITLTADGDGTVLRLRHSELPAAQEPDHRGGWDHFFGERLVEVARS